MNIMQEAKQSRVQQQRRTTTTTLNTRSSAKSSPPILARSPDFGASGVRSGVSPKKRNGQSVFGQGVV